MEANPNMRHVRIYGAADKVHTDDKFWQHEDYVLVHYEAGALFRTVFETYNYVCVRHHVPFGVLEHRLSEKTTLQTVIDELGLHEGVIEVYAFNV